MEGFMKFHGNVIVYLRAVAEAIMDATSQAPEGMPEDVAAQVEETGRKYAEILTLASEVMAETPVMVTVLRAVARAQEDQPEARLTTRKVAQA